MKIQKVLAFIIWTLVLSASAVSAQTPVQSENGRMGSWLDRLEGTPIAAVVITGNERISTEEIMARLRFTRVGAPFNSVRSGEEMKDIWNLYYERGFAGVYIRGPRIQAIP